NVGLALRARDDDGVRIASDVDRRHRSSESSASRKRQPGQQPRGKDETLAKHFKPPSRSGRFEESWVARRNPARLHPAPSVAPGYHLAVCMIGPPFHAGRPVTSVDTSEPGWEHRSAGFESSL